jgi:putative endopeptidase
MIRRLSPLLPIVLCTLLPAQPVKGVNLSYMQRDQNPCADFYRFTNGAYDTTPIPGAYAIYGVNQEIDTRNEAILKEILESAAADMRADSGSPTGRLRDFYLSGMDEAAIQHAGLAPLQPLFQRIHDLKSSIALAPLLAYLHVQGIQAGPYFSVEQDDKNSALMVARLYQGGLGLPERDYYFRQDETARKQRSAYVIHIAKLFELAGDPAIPAGRRAVRVMALETRLARASRKLMDLRDPEANYHLMDRGALARLAPAFLWEAYFHDLGLPASQHRIVVSQPDFLHAFSQLARTVPLADWRGYLRWCVLSTMAPFLDETFESESFAFHGKLLSGCTELFPRWKRVLQTINVALGEDLGQAFVKRAFSPTARVRVQEMIRFHKEALAASIRRSTWMSETTKVQALHKLEVMRSKVGYPDQWRDYSRMAIKRQPYALNILAANRFEFAHRMAKLGKPVDRDEWSMTPQTNNASYSANLNEILLPAGILQPPFFDEKADEASNYGALASTIGHEMLHGFDDDGSQYDADGNLRKWWTPEDRKAYDAQTSQVAQQFGTYEPLPGIFINGKQTLGENLADIGGLKISFEAWKLATQGKPQPSLDGLSPEQRYFVAFAQGWRGNMRSEALRLQLQSDVHSPFRWRVIGPVAVLPEFRKAFGCTQEVPKNLKDFVIW